MYTGLKYSLTHLIHALLYKQLIFSYIFSPGSHVRLNSNTALSIKQVTFIQYRVHQLNIWSKGDLSSTGESKDELDYRDNFDLTAARWVREKYL